MRSPDTLDSELAKLRELVAELRGECSHQRPVLTLVRGDQRDDALSLHSPEADEPQS